MVLANPDPNLQYSPGQLFFDILVRHDAGLNSLYGRNQFHGGTAELSGCAPCLRSSVVPP